MAPPFDLFKKVSQAPTNPQPTPARQSFDVADLYTGPAATATADTTPRVALDEKLRQAYFWIVNAAIISPYYDIEYNDAPPQTFSFGDQKSRLVLPSDQSYSSFVLMPLLNLVLRRRCLLVGGPGRGKTASAILMGVLAGYTIKDIKRAIQHGQPQMTISDLLGNPLPSTLVAAKSMDEVQISWRKWLAMRVKIIDEYNRIPTRTQSALLTVMGDNYAEVLDQIYECPEAAWYLTANDDAGGGTYQVIEALRDRIDIVVKALHFNTRFLGDLLARIEENIKPEEVVPREIVFTEAELDRAYQEILDVRLATELRRRIEFFASHFEFFDAAADQIEYKTKDTMKLAAIDFNLLSARDTGKDKLKDLGSQTRNGLSVRALMTLLVFAKALAWFRGLQEVGFEDVRQIIPFVLHDKLAQDADSPFFDAPENGAFRSDKVGWIRRLFDLSCAEYDRLDRDRDDVVAQMEAEFARGLEGVSEQEARARLVKIERTLADWSKGRKLYGHLFDDILKLKYLHQRYTNYLKWLQWKA
ncbi:MAG TPA: AAA family ATPase [Blastocatellia bacterium]|nr:AAA family ATPase [Blastocatellia bacterium]